MRRFHLAVGYASLVLGLAGIVLPLLPTTPFVILAAWCFARSNPALAERLYENPRFGPLLSTWRDQRAIPVRAKIGALLTLALSYAATVWLVRNPYVPFILAAVMGSVGFYILTRPSPREVAQDREGDRD